MTSPEIEMTNKAYYPLFIKNMVCPRCIMAVKTVLHDCGIQPEDVLLGEIRLPAPLTQEQETLLANALQEIGFELLSNPKRQIVERARSLIIDWIDQGKAIKLSDFLQENIQKEYSSISKLFTEVKGMTIEQYMKRVRIERVKEELCYGDKRISEIAYKYGFSSPAHLSAQFRSVTGMSPKKFQQLDHASWRAKRIPLDQV